jgi:hypothetical protein
MVVIATLVIFLSMGSLVSIGITALGYRIIWVAFLVSGQNPQYGHLTGASKGFKGRFEKAFCAVSLSCYWYFYVLGTSKNRQFRPR